MTSASAEHVLTAEDVAVLIDAATRAPSIHNTQPWRFAVRDDTVELLEDARRGLPGTDPAGRERLISCGAALLNLRLAAAHRGWHAATRLLPDLHRPELLATVRCAERRAPGEAEQALHAAIRERRMHRREFSIQPVGDAVVGRLVGAAEAEGARLLPVREARVVREVLDLVRSGAARQSADPRYRSELGRWLGFASGVTDGIPVRSLARVGPPVDGTPRHPLVALPDQPEDLAHVGVLAVLVTDGDRPADWLGAGQALERVLLTATHARAAVSLLNQAVEVADLRDELTRVVTAAGHPQQLLRIGYPRTTVPATPRRATGDVLAR